MQIDIRNEVRETIDQIIFADKSVIEKDCYLLTLEGSHSKLRSGWGEESYVYINSKEDALNLVKSLQKAIELGNWE